MTSAVKDKWRVGSSLNLSPIKAPIQNQRKPLNHRDIYTYEIKMQALKLQYLSLSWNCGFCFRFTKYKSRIKYRTHGMFCRNTPKVPLLFQDVSIGRFFWSYIIKTEKTEKINLDINLLSKPNKYKTEQTNRKKRTNKARTIFIKRMHDESQILYSFTNSISLK